MSAKPPPASMNGQWAAADRPRLQQQIHELQAQVRAAEDQRAHAVALGYHFWHANQQLQAELAKATRVQPEPSVPWTKLLTPQALGLLSEQELANLHRALKACQKKLSLHMHPDKGGDLEQMQEVNDAWQRGCKLLNEAGAQYPNLRHFSQCYRVHCI